VLSVILRKSNFEFNSDGKKNLIPEGEEPE
jgi:hypothetical protein